MTFEIGDYVWILRIETGSFRRKQFRKIVRVPGQVVGLGDRTKVRFYTQPMLNFAKGDWTIVSEEFAEDSLEKRDKEPFDQLEFPDLKPEAAAARMGGWDDDLLNEPIKPKESDVPASIFVEGIDATRSNDK